MNWKLILSRRAKRRILSLNKNLKIRIDKAVVNILNYYEDKSKKKPDLKVLKGKYKGILRLRVGKYRVLFKMSMKKREIFIIDIVSRSDLY